MMHFSPSKGVTTAHKIWCKKLYGFIHEKNPFGAELNYDLLYIKIAFDLAFVKDLSACIVKLHGQWSKALKVL